MKVLHLNTSTSGGSYEYARMLSDALAVTGIESQVLTKAPPVSQGQRELATRIVRRITVALSRETWHGAWRFLEPPAPELLEGADIVHLHVVNDWFNVPAWISSLPARIQVVASMHDLWHVSGGCFVYQGCERFESGCRSCPVLKPPAHWLLARHELRWKQMLYGRRGVRLVANSRWLGGMAAKSLVGRACAGLHVVPPGIDTNVFRPLDRQQCRDEMKLPAGRFIIVIGCAALTDPYKNIEWLLSRLSQSPLSGNALVVAFGDGQVPAPPGLDVMFMGAVRDRAKLARLFAAGDVYVSASRMETYGLTLVEAMACGTPVVAFRVGGVPEAAPEGEASILCEPQDGGALLAAIERLRTDPALRAELGRRGSEIAATRNGPDAFARACVEVYRECVEDPGAGSRRAAVFAGGNSSAH